MAGKGGGGAWKVAYADFVTAMMAFFLVMWLCAQNQEVKRSVADYFSDPLGALDEGSDKKPQKSGSATEHSTSGTVPLQERVAMGTGRRSHSPVRRHSPTTKMVSDWLTLDKSAAEYWHKQAKDQREGARWSADVKEKRKNADQVAIDKLAVQLREELVKRVPAKMDWLHRDLIIEALGDVNWRELAEDLLGP